MRLSPAIDGREFVLTEAAVDEFFRRSPKFSLPPRLENALFIYDDASRSALADLRHSFIAVARGVDVPFLLCTPTWRANKERLAEADIERDVNADAVAFAREVKDRWGSWGDHLVVGGMIGCKNDSYRPDQALSPDAAEEIHDWGDRMIVLNRQYGVKILGGCCGTRVAHLRYIADRLG
jgi:methionine synthase I (cobalamin-dependent)